MIELVKSLKALWPVTHEVCDVDSLPFLKLVSEAASANWGSILTRCSATKALLSNLIEWRLAAFWQEGHTCGEFTLSALGVKMCMAQR